MSLPRYKKVPLSEARVGEEYLSMTCKRDLSTITRMSDIVYLGDNKISMYGQEEEIQDKILYFERYWTFQEEEDWYIANITFDKPRNRLNLMGLFTDLYSCGGCAHELYNAWVGITAYELISNLEDETFYIVGVAPAPCGTACWSQEESIALVVEDMETGDRWWVHSKRDWIEEMRESMKDIYDKIMEDET